MYVTFYQITQGGTYIMSDEKILTQEQCKAVFRRAKLYILFLRRNGWKYKLDKYEFLLRKAYRIISVLEQHYNPTEPFRVRNAEAEFKKFETFGLFYVIFGKEFITSNGYKVVFQSLIPSYYTELYKAEIKIIHNRVCIVPKADITFESASTNLYEVRRVHLTIGENIINLPEIGMELKNFWNIFFGSEENIKKNVFPTYLPKQQIIPLIQEHEGKMADGQLFTAYSGQEKCVLHIKVAKKCRDLNEFLTSSGVLYGVKNTGVYIHVESTKQYHLLLKYTYHDEDSSYELILLR